MVNLMLQPVFLNLVKGSTDHKMTSDDLYNMWAVASRAKSAIVQGRRLENLSWRLWYTSTIRSKIEMEEKRRLVEEEEDKDVVVFNGDEDDLIKRRKERRKNSTLVLPSDRPLFTSTCTSILAEIQDASYRFRQPNLNSSHFQPYTSNNGISTNTTSNNTVGTGHVNNSISPPNNRSKSPGNSSISFTSKRKKNVEKFLKKFKSNLDDISEQFDEKATISDGEGVLVEHDTHKQHQNQHSSLDNFINHSNHVSVSFSLSPTASSSNNLATDDDEEDNSFFTRQNDFINQFSSDKPRVKKPTGMISKLLKKESNVNADLFTDLKPEPIHKNPPVKFLFPDEKDVKPVKEVQKEKIIDVNSLSTSLSASKFRLEDEFDSQIVIW